MRRRPERSDRQEACHPERSEKSPHGMPHYVRHDSSVEFPNTTYHRFSFLPKSSGIDNLLCLPVCFDLKNFEEAFLWKTIEML